MSFDLYLLPLQPEDSFDTAMSLLDALDRNDPEYSYELDAREAAHTILKLDGRYRPLQVSPEERKKYEGSSAADACLRIFDNSVQLNGRDEAGRPLAQFHFSRYHITIHCYDGTSADELDQYIIALCAATGLAAVDPQEDNVWRLLQDGTLG